MGNNWLNWCRLCGKDDVADSVQVYTDENASTCYGVLILAIGKYFNVHMRLEDGLSGVLCQECYVRIGQIIDYGKHVKKVQSLFETLRCSEPGKKLDLVSVRQQYGLREDCEIMKPVLELDNNKTMQSDGQETIDFVDFSEIVQQSQTLGNTDETSVNQLPLQEITNSGGNTVNDTQNRLRKRTVKIRYGDKNEEDSSSSAEQSEAHSSGSECENDYDLDKSTKRRRLECRNCSKVYWNPGSFKKHLQLNNCRKKEQRFKLDKRVYCQLCDKTLSSASYFKKHQESVHSRPYVCDHCGKQVKNIRALNEHKLVHTEDHNFKCNLCDANFKRSSTLKRHLLSHKGLRPYACNYCDKTYACKTQLGYHKKKKHPNEFKKEEAESSMCPLKLPTLNELRVLSKIQNADLEEVNICS